MPILFFLLFAMIWYYPVWQKQGKLHRLSGKRFFLGLFLGAIPAMLICLILQTGIGILCSRLHFSSVITHLIDALICAALIEEGFKFFFAKITCKKSNANYRIDYVLLFGAVGLGFQIIESVMAIDGVLTAIIRGVLAYHIIWQFWMGYYYYDLLDAKESGDKKKKAKAFFMTFIVPIFMHFACDFIAFMAVDAVNAEDLSGSGIETWAFAFVAFILFSIIFLFKTLKMVYKAAKEKREVEIALNEEEKAENEPSDD